MGNWSTSDKTTYHKYFLVFWPKKDEFKINCKTDLATAVTYLHKDKDIVDI